MANDSMDVDMDIDYTLDQTDDPEIARLKAEAAAFDAPAYGVEGGTTNGVEEAPEEGEVDQNALVPKIHVHGMEVDSLNPRDVENYAREHYLDDLFGGIEWVNDHAFNIVYDTEVTAAEALQAFSLEEMADPLQERPAKPLSTHPDVQMFVRHAVESDVKVKKAAQYSAFYLRNPEWDPETKKRRFNERGYRDRGDYGQKRRRREMDDDRYSRRSSQGEPFDVNLYDDDPASLAKRRDSRSENGSDQYRKKPRFQDDLMAFRENGRLRNRSASPARDGDGRYGFAEDQPRRPTARPRSRTPPRPRSGRDNRTARDNLRQELFPDKKASSTLTNGHSNDDLFPNRSSPPKGKIELFPKHSRHDARDLDIEYREVEDGISRYNFDGTDERLTYGSSSVSARSGRRSAQSRVRDEPRGGDLMSRISGGPTMESSYGRLHDRPKMGEEFSFRGAGGGSRNGDAGFSILGASRERVENPLVQELFPMKAGGGGKGRDSGRDLFEGRLKGRGGGQRRRAEDLF